jgi:hypothetical protein
MKKATMAVEHIWKELEVHLNLHMAINTLIQEFKFLQNIPGHILITFDVWTSGANDPYLTIMAHYIVSPERQPNNWELCSKMFRYTSIEGNHSGANTTVVILHVIDHYGI